MALEDWFTVHDSGKRGAFIASYGGHCVAPGAVLRGEEEVPVPMEFGHHMGMRVYDWIPTSLLWLILISARLQGVLREGHFTGWDTIPANVYHERDGFLDGYGCLVLSGRTGRVVRDASRVEWRPPPVPNGRPSMARVGLHVDFTPWDGSDICTTAVGVYVLVNRAVKNALVKAKVTGVQFTRLDQYELTDSEATHQLWKEMGYE